MVLNLKLTDCQSLRFRVFILVFHSEDIIVVLLLHPDTCWPRRYDILLIISALKKGQTLFIISAKFGQNLRKISLVTLLYGSTDLFTKLSVLALGSSWDLCCTKVQTWSALYRWREWNQYTHLLWGTFVHTLIAGVCPDVGLTRA